VDPHPRISPAVLTRPDDYLAHVAVTDAADLRRLVVDEFASRKEVARVETRLILQQWSRGPLPPQQRTGEVKRET
jgi:hypothetical protein